MQRSFAASAHSKEQHIVFTPSCEFLSVKTRNRPNRIIETGIKCQVIYEVGSPHLWLTFANIPHLRGIPQCDLAPDLIQTFSTPIFFNSLTVYYIKITFSCADCAYT